MKHTSCHWPAINVTCLETKLVPLWIYILACLQYSTGEMFNSVSLSSPMCGEWGWRGGRRGGRHNSALIYLHVLAIHVESSHFKVSNSHHVYFQTETCN